MQFKLSVATALALATLAAATPTRRTDTPGSGPSNQCNTGSLQCCNSTSSASDPSTALLLGLLGVVVGDISALVGISCSPISVIAVSGTSCSEQPVCCTNNSFNGLVALGCTPINLNA